MIELPLGAAGLVEEGEGHFGNLPLKSPKCSPIRCSLCDLFPFFTVAFRSSEQIHLAPSQRGVLAAVGAKGKVEQ